MREYVGSVEDREKSRIKYEKRQRYSNPKNADVVLCRREIIERIRKFVPLRGRTEESWSEFNEWLNCLYRRGRVDMQNFLQGVAPDTVEEIEEEANDL